MYDAGKKLRYGHEDAATDEGSPPSQALNEIDGRRGEGTVGDGEDERYEVRVVHARSGEESRAVAEPEGDARGDGEEGHGDTDEGPS